MEKLILNHYDKEHLKIAMLKHEETFREQVSELHRLYRIQKMLMKDAAESLQKNDQYVTTCQRAKARLCLDRERPAFPGSVDDTVLRVSEAEDEHTDLELTLGPKSYHHHKKIKASWGPKMAVPNNQDRLNRPPWLFQALSMNIT